MLTHSDLKLGGELSRDAVSFYELHSGSPFHLPVLAKFASASAHGKPASAKLEFLGKSLFIPIFFVVTGFLINPVTFVWGILDNFLLVASIVGALLLGKWMAAWAISQAFGYTLDEQLTIWSLTLPQVAATLAATLVAHETLGEAGQRLLDDRMLNVVLVLVFATSILGPVLTERFASRLAAVAPAPN